jgi:hypothetical protein
MTFFHLPSFPKNSFFDRLQVLTHGLSGRYRIAPLDGGEDFLMALERPPFSFLGLKIPFPGLSQKVEKGEQESF